MKINFKHICIIIFFTSCTKPNLGLKEILEKTILSKEFHTRFRICERDANRIDIYNDVSKFENIKFSSVNSCSKEINFLKLNFKYNINSHMEKYKGIVFYKYKVTENWIQLSFIDLGTKGNLVLKYDNNLKLLEKEEGAF